MNDFEFYKELYYKVEDKKNEINNSLSIPISIITGFVAAIFYLLTNFNYNLPSKSIVFSNGALSICPEIILLTFFIIINILVLYFLSLSTYFLIMAYTNFHNGYEYSYLADSNDLHAYYLSLKEYYKKNIGQEDISEKEYESFIIQEFIKNTDYNQKQNKIKSYNRYISLKHLITAILFICLNIFPFTINYNFKKGDENNVSLKINPVISSQRINIKNKDSITLNLKLWQMKNQHLHLNQHLHQVK